MHQSHFLHSNFSKNSLSDPLSVTVPNAIEVVRGMKSISEGLFAKRDLFVIVVGLFCVSHTATGSSCPYRDWTAQTFNGVRVTETRKCQEGDFIVKSISGPIPLSYPVPHRATHYVLEGHKLDISNDYLLMEGTRLELIDCITGRVSIILGPGQIKFERDSDHEPAGTWKMIPAPGDAIGE
jgi:hypothetical protein